MEPDSIDWAALDRLRSGFLQGTAGSRDYWQSDRDLATYDATFAQRIAWKWDFVFGELQHQGWSPPAGEWLDWGCGSGIAARVLLHHAPPGTVTAVRFLDRSPRATRFATERLRAKFPDVAVHDGVPTPPAFQGILVSHVLTELQPRHLDDLLELVKSATAVLWVEPGTHETSRALIAIRERLRNDFHPVSPCVHALTCGMLAAGNERHWCHHFAPPPGHVFTDPLWGRFSHQLGIDLRSVPLSYLVLDRRETPPLPIGAFRRIGRPITEKGAMRVLGCDAGGVRNFIKSKREDPATWKQAHKDRLPSLLSW